MVASKYEREAIAIRKNLRAAGVLIVVLDGRDGTGGCAAVLPEANRAWLEMIPRVLRDIADDMERGTYPGDLVVEDDPSVRVESAAPPGGKRGN